MNTEKVTGYPRQTVFDRTKHIENTFKGGSIN